MSASAEFSRLSAETVSQYTSVLNPNLIVLLSDFLAGTMVAPYTDILVLAKL